MTIKLKGSFGTLTGAMSVGDLQNGTPASAELIPTMTANTVPSGTASSKGNYGAFYPWKAMDKVIDEPSFWLTTSSNLPSWLRYQLPTAKTVTSYTIMASIDPPNVSAERSPKDWTFEGSNDGSSWDVLDTVTGETTWGFQELRSYDVDSPTSYLYYQINVSANNGAAASYVNIAELQLLGY